MIRRAVLLGLVGVGACGGGSDPAPTTPVKVPVLTTLTVTLSASTIASGQQSTAAAVGRDQDGIIMPAIIVDWSSSAPTTATVTASGVATGVRVGSTAIQALSGSRQATAMLTVTPGSAAAVTLARNPAGAVNGYQLATQPIAEIRDAAGNLLTGDNASAVSMTASTGGSLSGVTSRTVSGGVATFSGLGLSGVVGATYTLTFSAGALQSATQGVTIQPFSFGNGTRIVGTEIPAGRYRSNNAASASCYWERLSGFGGTLGEIIANDIGGGPAVVQVLASDRGFSSSSCATWFEVHGPITAGVTAPFGPGTFVVGSDIVAGTWRSDGTGASCYWVRLRNFTGVDDIIANNLGASPAIVTIAPTDVGFNSSRCGTWTRLP